MGDLIIRFIVGGVIVSFFAVLGDLFKPKSFAGLFGAAPSVALATIPLTILKDGKVYAAAEARSMIAGAIAFFVYASFVSWWMMHRKARCLPTTGFAIVIWVAIALGLWSFWLG